MDQGCDDHDRPRRHVLHAHVLRLIRSGSGQLDVGRFVTHRFALDQIMDGYDVFASAGSTGALKVVLSRL